MIFTGSLNADTALKWVAEGHHCINKAGKECIIDLGAVQRINSAGIAILLALERYAHAQKKSLVFKNPPKELVSMLELYDLSSLFSLSLEKN